MRSILEESMLKTRIILSKIDRDFLVTYLEASRDLCETDPILFGAARQYNVLLAPNFPWLDERARGQGGSTRIVSSSDQKRLYKSLERPSVCGAGPGPDQADTVAFWRGLWSEPVNHSEGP
ncbi:unnamed protein product [Parnassius apollo]|uniref:(apollo) hypothetical protein n=1 Tax=Parnassius apollo TaxID=110799 RepID=A0A8S3W628_PARAO|nr:unnamed protein product [Parnassius apollo]